MEFLAVAIFLSVVLYLVDKNQQWAQFWKVLKWSSRIAIVGGVVLFASAIPATSPTKST
jgi:hypothetical protein